MHAQAVMAIGNLTVPQQHQQTAAGSYNSEKKATTARLILMKTNNKNRKTESVLRLC